MEAGRELDALIAEKVMGHGSQKMLQQMPDGTFQPIEGIWPLCPEYSTDIADAMLICPHFNNRVALYGPNAGVWNEYMNGDEWTCEITIKVPSPYRSTVMNDEGITASAPTAPLAICLAALKAIA